MQQDVGVGVAVEPLFVRDFDPTYDEAPAGHQRMDVEALPDLHVRLLRMPSAIARSSVYVTLMFSRLPAMRRGLRLRVSTAEASSVAPGDWASARMRSPARNICGVCASQTKDR